MTRVNVFAQNSFVSRNTVKAGFVQVFFKRVAFIEFVKATVFREASPEFQEKILPKCGSFLQFVETFARPPSAAAVGASTLTEETNDGGGVVGIANAVSKQFGEFAAELPPRESLRDFALPNAHWSF